MELIPKNLLKESVIHCPFCIKKGYSQKNYHNLWRLKCHCAVQHPGESFDLVIEARGRGR